MSKVNYLVTKEIIHLNFDGRYLKLTVNDKEFGEVRQLIKEGRQDEIPALLGRSAVPLDEYIEGSGLALVDGVITDMQGNPLPKVLGERLKEFRDEGFPVEPLIAFWNNLKENPSEASKQQLYGFLENNGHPITEDGHFVAYRTVRSDWKDKHSGTFDNSPGSVCEMERSLVDPDPYSHCSVGLHVASHNYATKSFKNEYNGDITVEVKVNPRDVVAVPNDYNGQKMRVCRFEVIQVCEKELATPLYGQAVKTWADYKAEEEKDPEPSEELIEEIVDYAVMHKDRYTDRAMLAVRVEEALQEDSYLWLDDEDVTVDVALVLKVINEKATEIFGSYAVDTTDTEEDDEEDTGYGWN